jgi:hypothetical protein
MAFTYTDVLGGASPIRGGRFGGFALINCGDTAASVDNLVSTTLASVVFATINVYGAGNQASARIASVSSNGMIGVNLGAACSGSILCIGN